MSSDRLDEDGFGDLRGEIGRRVNQVGQWYDYARVSQSLRSQYMTLLTSIVTVFEVPPQVWIGPQRMF